MNPELEQVGGQIKARRKQRDWSQKYLATICGCNRPTIGAMERGNYTEIGIRKVAHMLHLVGFKNTLSEKNFPTQVEILLQQNSETVKTLQKDKLFPGKDLNNIITGCNYL